MVGGYRNTNVGVKRVRERGFDGHASDDGMGKRNSGDDLKYRARMHEVTMYK